ncbi:MAG: hypothetical protein QXX68_02065 [Candidatus Pacearchaeota archaeon]
MDKRIKNFVESAYRMGKDEKYVRDYLFGKIKDIELNEALEYFNSLSKKKKKLVFFSVIYSIIRVFFLYISFLAVRFLVFLRNSLSKEKIAEVDFRQFEEEIKIKNIFEKIKNWFLKKSEKEKKKILLISALFLFFLGLLIYANFFYYMKCPNETCFRDRMERCERAKYESKDFILLFNRIYGRDLDSCNSRVAFYDKQKNKKLVMECSTPLRERNLPYSRIEYCTGELREYIQEKMINELQSTVSENILELNHFFRN